ncbi:MAG: hypothetical protein FJW09_09110 [Actinobacteria bacterium]|nr:hypothetical protein [Actinomycetota bacterium]
MSVPAARRAVDLSNLRGGIPAVMAHERLLPVHPVLAPLFGVAPGDPGLVRGHTVVCSGSAALSCALAVVAAPTQVGSWAGVVGLPSVGVSAAAELGVVLSRTVFVTGASSSSASSDMAAVISALVDGVEVLVLSRQVVGSVSGGVIRKLHTRLQSRGGVLVVVDDPGSVTADVRLAATTTMWDGVGAGNGHLQRRRVSIELEVRRRGRPTRADVWLPDHRGGLSMCDEQSSGNVSSGNVLPLHRTG